MLKQTTTILRNPRGKPSRQLQTCSKVSLSKHVTPSTQIEGYCIVGHPTANRRLNLQQLLPDCRFGRPASALLLHPHAESIHPQSVPTLMRVRIRRLGHKEKKARRKRAPATSLCLLPSSPLLAVNRHPGPAVFHLKAANAVLRSYTSKSCMPAHLRFLELV